MRPSFPSIRLLVGLIALTVISCQSAPDKEALRAEILALHQAGIQAHWDKDAAFLASNLADDFFSVGNGEIRHPSTEEVRTGFESYLGSATFSEYRDLQKPIVGFSDDGSAAWSVVQVKVSGRRQPEDGPQREMDFTCAWITLYRRQGDGWLKLGEVSSFK